MKRFPLYNRCCVGVSFYGQFPDWTATLVRPDSAQFVISQIGSGTSVRIVPNANECAPGGADAV